MAPEATAGAVELSSAPWECAGTPPGALADAGELVSAPLSWRPAAVPGTAAAAAVAAGVPGADHDDYDASDWWFRCRFEAPPGRFRLELGGVATVSQVWLDGELVASSENMFVPFAAPGSVGPGAHELVICCRALQSLLAERRPRPRWKSYLVTHQNLRWYRTTLLGRLHGWAGSPPPVGPWRPVRLVPADAPSQVHLTSSVSGGDGHLEVSLRLGDGAPHDGLVVSVAGGRCAMEVSAEAGVPVARGTLVVPHVERWWPHTHGPQPLYPVVAEWPGGRTALGKVGFRTVEVERDGGDFSVVVNGQPIFCRGACWLPPDPRRLHVDPEVRRAGLELARRGNMNMLRVPGTSVYEDAEFFSLCDELGIMVWQDCMFGFLDPPADADFEAAVLAELDAVLPPLAAHPSLAVLCGSQEVEEIATMNGLAAGALEVPLFDKLIPAAAERHLPGVPYVTSNPTGGDPPFRMDQGVSQYFGVGGYMRPLEDARRASVRFAAECLALATPPSREMVEEYFGGAVAAGHDPAWKAALHHDAGRSFDMEDVRDHYVGLLFGADTRELRLVDPERALDLGRAANAELVSSVFSEWRRPASPCRGGLVLAFRDLKPGAGWGLVASDGSPKAPWYAARRVFAPISVLVTDEGLNGLRCHLVNDTEEAFAGSLRVELFARGEVPTDAGERRVVIAARGALEIDAGGLLEGFRDLAYAYRFGPPAHDVVGVSLLDGRGAVVAQAVHLPLGQTRPLEADLGLTAVARREGEGATVEVSTARFAQFVAIEAPGFVPEDSWFHLLPGARRRVALEAREERPRLRGKLRALNCQRTTAITEAS